MSKGLSQFYNYCHFLVYQHKKIVKIKTYFRYLHLIFYKLHQGQEHNNAEIRRICEFIENTHGKVFENTS